MKRRYIESIAFVSLIGYVAIVLAGQLAHWIPGWGCGCHTSWKFSAADVVSIPDAFRAEVTQNSDRFRQSEFLRDLLGVDTNRKDRNSVVETNGDCLICDWFSMAQEKVPTSRQVAAVVSTRFDGAFFDKQNPEFPIGIFLPRGPPLS